MPSPFPGMDPYLGGSSWMSVRTPLAVEIMQQINPKLPTRYVAMTTRRFVIDLPEASDAEIGELYPDVAVASSRRDSDGGEPAIRAMAAPLSMATIVPSSIPQVTVKIRDAKSRRLVTVIEVLSLTNKRGLGRQEYLERRGRILLSRTHLMEIDLLRQGKRVPMKGTLPAHPYFVFLNRSERNPITDIWPIALDQPLPKVPVPLLAGDDDVELELQPALNNVYEAGGFERLIDYTEPPEVPLTSEEAAWVDELLKRVELRS